MKPRAWTVTRTTRRGDYKVFSVDALQCRREGDGREHEFYRIESAPWVNIVARTRAREFVMVRQHRLGAGEVTLEIPGGLVDAGEEPQDAAARELLEETGYRAGSLHKLGAVNPNPALFANTLHTYLADGCERVADVVNDPNEETIVELVPESELAQRVHAGEVNHALVLAAFYWLHQAER